MEIIREPDRSLEVEFVRRRVFCVYHTFYSSTPLDKTGKKNINLSDPKHFIKAKRTIDLGSKKIQIDAETIRAGETFRYKGSTTLISEINFRHLSWSRAIRELPTFQQSWLKYCYGNSNDFADHTIVCEHIWNEFLKVIALRKIKIKKSTFKIIRNLVWLAVQASIVKIHTDKNLYKQSYLAFLVGKSKQAWCQNFNDKWDLLLGICLGIDSEALTNVERHHCD